MKDKQELRNALSNIEDEARQLRNNVSIFTPELQKPFDLIAKLTQIVREEIVK